MGKKDSPNHRGKVLIGGIEYQKYDDEDTEFC